MLGRERPCEGCPAKKGFTAAAGQKKSHSVADRYYTEVFSLSPTGGGGLLLFRDTTRQVELIEMIKENRDEIDRKNRILSLLVEFGTYLHKQADTKEVIQFFFDKFMPILGVTAAAVIVKDIRPGNLWLAEARGLREHELDRLSKACLARDMQKKQADLIAPEFLPWESAVQEPLRGSLGNWLGNLVLPGTIRKEDQEVVSLLVETLGAYLQNQLLLRQLEEKAHRDAMTGLYNRGFIEQALTEEQVKFEKYHIPYAVVLADVDRLKKVNDEFGHEVGDLMIIEAGRALQRSMRETDILARTGGDEFLILLTGTNDDSARVFVERLKERFVRDLFLSAPDQELIPVTVSLGWAGSDKYPPEQLVNEADRIMYVAKRNFYQGVQRYR
jgi:diguanylate cyclase (GGDEF)-like protein